LFISYISDLGLYLRVLLSFYILFLTPHLSFLSKYIAQLKDKAEQRKREQDIIYERKLQKERNKEDHLFGDKEKFVTSAYRKKLEEQQKWLEEEKRRQRLEEKDDVSFVYMFTVIHFL
jgi:predicted Holliday junction resolvase-like endonuclease